MKKQISNSLSPNFSHLFSGSPVMAFFHRNFSLTIFITIIFFGTGAFSQEKDVEFNKASFPNDIDKLKEAIREIKEGDRYYHVASVLHPIALEHFLKAQAFNPNNAELNMKIGRSYLNSNQKLKALEHLEKSLRLDAHLDEEIHLYLGQAYQLHRMWDKAIEEYNVYKKNIPESDDINQKILNKKIVECNNGKELEKKPLKVKIENMEPLNTPFAEYGPVISADESVLIFTARRDNTTGGGKDPFVNQFYEDIYISHSDNGSWSTAENIGPPINTEAHDGAIGLSVDGQKLFVYVDDHGNGNIYVSQLKGKKWSQPKKMDNTINSVYRESSASFSPDGKTLYFVSNKPDDNLGDRDIFYSKIDEKGKWGKPLNIGPVINTEYGEEGVFMHPDGKTLFFSSQGHNSMGGYDIFMSVFDETAKTWAKPENMGSPVNTPDDDVFIVLSADSKHAYYTSVRSEGKGEKDIYRISFLEDVMNKNVALLKGKVVDQNGNPVGAKITVKNKSTGEIVGTFESNSSTGKYLISLPSGKNYEIEVESEGYVTAVESMDIAYKNDYQEIPKDFVLKSKSAFLFGKVVDESGNGMSAEIEVIDNSTNQTIGRYRAGNEGSFRITVPTGKNYGVVFTKPGYLFQSVNAAIPDSVGFEKDLGNIMLQKVDVGKKIVLNNIFFDFNKASLRQESLSELERAVTLMNNMVSLQIEISGHTDNVGSQSYNQRLSEQRAKAVVEFLISKGVEKKRLVYKGYAFSQPISTNETEEGRQMNRRTEFKVLKVDVEAEQIAEAKRMKERIEAGEKMENIKKELEASANRAAEKAQTEATVPSETKTEIPVQIEEKKEEAAPSEAKAETPVKNESPTETVVAANQTETKTEAPVKVNQPEAKSEVPVQSEVKAENTNQPESPAIQEKKSEGTSKVPERFKEADKDGNGNISSVETIAVIDSFFEGTTQMKVEDILALIDYFFDQ